MNVNKDNDRSQSAGLQQPGRYNNSLWIHIRACFDLRYGMHVRGTELTGILSQYAALLFRTPVQ